MSTAHRRHWPRYVLALTTLIVLAAGSTAYAIISEVPVPPPGSPCQGLDCVMPTTAPPPPPGKPQTFLLIGSDARTVRSSDGDIGRRSDTLMLARIGGGHPTTLLSIPRDTQVEIPMKGGSSHVGKINEAFGEGGPALTTKVVRSLIGVPINHVAVIDFEAFQRAVNRLGCLYEDVDRSYFNNVTGPGGYAAIDVKSGYQLLCGGDTLSWVRFRHTDSDLVRGQRQQAFLRSAKEQVALSKLFDNRTALIKLFERYVHTDIRTAGAMIGVIKLMAGAAGDGTRSIPFEAEQSSDPANTNLIATPAALARMRRAFLATPRAATTPAPRKHKARKAGRKTSSTALAPGLATVNDAASREDLAQASFDLADKHLPVYVPTARYAQGGWADRDPVRTYAIKASRFGKTTYPAFRMTWSAGGGAMLGQYYGLQGTTWKEAPILQGTHHAVQRRGRTLQVYMAGNRPQLVAWSTPRAVYWVSNSISLALTTRQLVDIAASLKRMPG